MSVSGWLDVLFLKTWWRYDPKESSWAFVPYHLFNLFEGGVWTVLACLVLARHMRHRRSRLELWYALAFLTFGLTDFREAYALTSWLIWLKLVNLLLLLWARTSVIRRFYPASKLY